MTHRDPTPAQASIFPGLTPEQVIDQAHAEHGPFLTRICLFSGGHDSTVTAFRCRDYYDSLAFVDTTTAVPGVREFVEDFAAWIDKPLRVMEHDDDAYRNLVLGDDEVRRSADWAPLGFPGPAQHGRCYNRLKERQIERLLREIKTGHPRSSRVLFVTGVRRAESQRRAHRPAVSKKGAQVFCNPLIDWTSTIDRPEGEDR